jgi:hypothetical protein
VEGSGRARSRWPIRRVACPVCCSTPASTGGIFECGELRPFVAGRDWVEEGGFCLIDSPRHGKAQWGLGRQRKEKKKRR